MTHGTLDRFGRTASTLCALHCIAGGAAPAVVTALGCGVILTHQAEWLTTLTAVSFAVGSGSFSFRIHRSWKIVGCFAGLVLLLILARLLETWGLDSAAPVLAVTSGVGLALTHTVNLKCCRRIRDKEDSSPPATEESANETPITEHDAPP